MSDGQTQPKSNANRRTTDATGLNLVDGFFG